MKTNSQHLKLWRGLGIILILFLAACAPANNQPAPDASTATAPATTPALPPITDALGRTVTLAQAPQRIVITGRAHFMITDAAYLFPQARERVIGLSSAGQKNDFTGVIEPQLDAKLKFNSDSGAEDIAAISPDLVLLKSVMAESLGAELEQIGIPVVYLDLETPEQYRRDLGILGQVFGDAARAAHLVAYYDELQQRVDTALTGIADTERPRVLLVQVSEKGGEVAFNVPPVAWIQTQLVLRAGGTPVWQEAAQGNWAVVNLEQIAAWDPDQVYVVDYFGDVVATVERLRADPLWQNLRATREGQIFAFPKEFYSWDQPDPRWGLGLIWLASTLHPQQITINMRQEIQTFYADLYGMDGATIAAQVFPRLQGITLAPAGE